MSILSIVILAAVQGLAELLPVSSSAHVIVAEKMLGLDPTAPEMTLLLVMLHTGTMLAVIIYFWRSWADAYFSSWERSWPWIRLLILATILTGMVGMTVKTAIERYVFRNAPKAEIELLFGNLPLMAVALAAAGILIIWSGLRYHRAANDREVPVLGRQAAWMGIVQGLCLPFRGFSRSGATISCGLLTGASRRPVEEFSFALAVILTPPVVIRETMRLIASRQSLEATGAGSMPGLFLPGLLGLVLSFLAGLLALRWLTRWLDRGRWHYFGYYCLFAAIVVLMLHFMGYY
ncbi:MAG: undecaprenyl-diphosphate phosphatase [Syntrophorhabdales bacterium]